MEITSRGPNIEGSNLILPLLVESATVADMIPLFFINVDSMRWTHDAHVIPFISISTSPELATSSITDVGKPKSLIEFAI